MMGDGSDERSIVSADRRKVSTSARATTANPSKPYTPQGSMAALVAAMAWAALKRDSDWA